MLITLTTDFGLDDPYVAMMKGVILGRCPEVRLVDICHTIAPQDISSASQQLNQAAPFFPTDTIHVAVVDPGVGTNRRIICLEHNNQLFLAPDNGLLSPFFKDATAAFQVDNEALYRHPVSTTFHGRDIFAPVAAALAEGLAPHELGPELSVNDLIRLDLPQPTMDTKQLRGQCLRADRFGNLSTNISAKDLESFLDKSEVPVISIGDTLITGLSSTYGHEKGEVIALINSSAHLEISIAGGNAADQLHIATGTPVVITKLHAH